jgi:predicted porin
MKTFTKNASALAILAALAAPGLAAADATLYGKAHLSFGSVSEDDGVTDTSSNAVTSHSSRVGVKGSTDTEGTAQFIYKFEWEVDMADEKDAEDNHIKSRSQFVGIKDSWGEVRLGRDDSPYKNAGKKSVEFLSDTWADFNNIIDKGQDTRNDDSIAYWGKIGPGTLGVMYAAGDDDPAAENAGESTSIAYDMKMGKMAFALATQTISDAGTVGNDETGTKLGFGYTMGNTNLGLMLETVENDDNTVDDKNSLFSVKHGLSKTDSIIFEYGVKSQGLADDATMTALSYQHKMGKGLSLYGLYVNGADGGLSDNSKLDGDSSVLVLGMVAAF